MAKKSLFSKIMCAVMTVCLTFGMMVSVMSVAASAGGSAPTGEWFSYCENVDSSMSSIGTGNPSDSYVWAIKIPKADLPERDVLSVVSFFVVEASTSTVCIYSAEEGTTPNGAVPDYQQDVTVSGGGYWKNIILNTPYSIDKTKDLWIGIRSTNAAYPAAYSPEIVTNTDTCMMYFQGEWKCVNQLGDLNIQPWLIRGYFGVASVHTITDGTTDTNGIVSISETSALADSAVEISVKTDEEYYLLNTLDVTYNDGKDNHTILPTRSQSDPTLYSFVMPAYDVTVKATFKWTGKPLPIYRNAFLTDPEDSGWKNIDADGDGYKWNWLSGDGCMRSISWSRSTSSLTPNNWLISPKISIPADGAAIHWDEKGGSASYPEHYGVYLCTKNEKPENANDLEANYFEIFDTNTSSTSYQRKTVQIPAEYWGEDYYIAFRHYDSYDKWDMTIDNFEVRKLPRAVNNDAPSASEGINHGYITIDKDTAEEGDTVTIIVEPSEGYQIDADTLKVYYNDGTRTRVIIPKQDAEDETKYTFTMPAYEVSVKAAFEKVEVRSETSRVSLLGMIVLVATVVIREILHLFRK